MSSLVVKESCRDLNEAPILLPNPLIASAVVATWVAPMHRLEPC